MLLPLQFRPNMHQAEHTCSGAAPPPLPTSFPNSLKLNPAPAAAAPALLLPLALAPAAAAAPSGPAFCGPGPGPDACLRLLGALLLAARPMLWVPGAASAAAAGSAAGMEADLVSSSTVCWESASTSICSSCMMSPSCGSRAETRRTLWVELLQLNPEQSRCAAPAMCMWMLLE